MDTSCLKDKKESLGFYWSLKDIVEKAQKDRFEGSLKEAVNHADSLLSEAVKLRMESDVPLGVFLSGGIDSSLVTALMQKQSAQKVKTFTIGFNEPGYNEAAQAKLVARHLGTEHTEFYVTPDETMAVIPRLAEIYDEPFSDSSQIPTFLVSELTRKQVTVSLSGDGGDEVFAGYNRYFWVKNIWRNIGWINKYARDKLAAMLTAISPEKWERIFRNTGKILPKKARQRTPGDKIHKLADILSADSPYDMYLGLVSHWRNTELLVPGSGNR